MFHLLVEVGFFPFYEHGFLKLNVILSSCREQDLYTNLLHFNPVPWIVKLWRDLESTVARCWHTAHLKKSWVVKISAPS